MVKQLNNHSGPDRLDRSDNYHDGDDYHFHGDGDSVDGDGGGDAVDVVGDGDGEAIEQSLRIFREGRSGNFHGGED